MNATASPTLGSWVVLGAAGAIAAVLLGEPALAALAAPFALAAIAALAFARDPELDVTGSVAPQRLLEGDPVTVAYEIASAAGAAWIELRAAPPAGLHVDPDQTVHVLRLAPGDRRRIQVTLHADSWGGYRVGAAHLAATGALGGVHFTGALASVGPVRVLPAVQRLRALVAPARTQTAVGDRRSRMRGEGLELADVRPYAPGDPIRRLHWRAGARTGIPYVADRHPERSADVVLFIDTFAEVVGERETALTLAVRAGAALADAHLRARDRVGVVAFGGVMHWLAPGSGVRHALRISDALAASEVFMSYVSRDVALVPPAILRPRALVLAITPLIDERGARAILDLASRGHDLVIVEIDALGLVDVQRDLAVRLWALRHAAMRIRLAEQGAPVVTWDGGRPLESVVREVMASRRASRLPARA